MHRGAEKLFEVRDYRQIIVLANRHDWLSAFSNELGVVLGVERMLGMEVPERAVWARTLLAELNRVLNHLMFLGSYPLELGAITPIFYAFREREELQAVMEEASGGRMHYMFNRVGGLKEDLPAGWLGRVAARRRRRPRAGCPTSRRSSSATRSSEARTRGVGVLARETVAAYGVSGPIARASRRRRRPAPRRALPRLRRAVRRRRPRPGRHPHRRATAWPGSRCCSSRRTSASTSPTPASTGCGRCPPGPINVRLPKVLKVPEGDLYTATENPLGFNGYYLVSRGEKTPWRLKLRSASFNNVAGAAPSCCRAAWSPTWSRSWARCSSSSATSTSSLRRRRDLVRVVTSLRACARRVGPVARGPRARAVRTTSTPERGGQRAESRSRSSGGSTRHIRWVSIPPP